ncbi:MAG: aryl-sulfate sulfotransferase [Proteobacteria bacterium]|nr:aryl-sulfate sulfotransferase [Pseudomonadota bacterium]
MDSGAPEAERDWVSFTRALASDAYGGSIRLDARIATPPKDEHPGRWRPRRPVGDGLDAEQRALIARLEAIGYAQGSQPAVERTGVVVHARGLAQPGYNFYTSGHAAEAFLTDLEGNVLHRWAYPFERAFPERKRALSSPSAHSWRRARLYENGDVVAIYEGLGLVRIDADSNLLWARFNHAHHDLEAQPNGDIYVLTRRAHVVSAVDRRLPILEDSISILGPDGEAKSEISLLAVFENSAPAHAWRPASRAFWASESSGGLVGQRGPGDFFHTNSLRVLEGDLSVPGFQAGNILVSFCHLNRIAVIDPRTMRAVWSVDGLTRLQHDPVVTPDGGILVFDNHWRPGLHSRVVELDPRTGAVVWQYAGTEDAPLYSRSCGTAAPLANGNVLITESDNGRALEITRDGEVVWEFYNPNVAGKEDEFIATLFDLVRLPANFPMEWAERPGEGVGARSSVTGSR